MKDNLLAEGAKLTGYFDVYKTVMRDFKRLGISNTNDRFRDIDTGLEKLNSTKQI